MMNRRQVALEATAKALALRRRLGYHITDAVSPIDAAEKLGIDVRLVDFPSMEGMYVSGAASAILLSALRPPGRRHYTCAHEIGHHEYGHGDQFDELVEEQTQLHREDIKEYQANTFASFFLMPKTAVEHALHVRTLTYADLTPTIAYALANWLGVGYATLVQHLFYSLTAITTEKWSELRALQPKQIRERLVDGASAQGLWVVDKHWRGRALDVEVGDSILAPTGSHHEGLGLVPLAPEDQRQLIRAVAPGLARIVMPHDGAAVFVRISRKTFTGRSCFRFEDDQ